MEIHVSRLTTTYTIPNVVRLHQQLLSSKLTTTGIWQYSISAPKARVMFGVPVTMDRQIDASPQLDKNGFSLFILAEQATNQSEDGSQMHHGFDVEIYGFIFMVSKFQKKAY